VEVPMDDASEHISEYEESPRERRP